MHERLEFYGYKITEFYPYRSARCMHDVYVCNLNNNVVKTIMAGELSLFNMQELFSGNKDNCKQAIKRFCDNQITRLEELKYMVDIH